MMRCEFITLTLLSLHRNLWIWVVQLEKHNFTRYKYSALQYVNVRVLVVILGYLRFKSTF